MTDPDAISLRHYLETLLAERFARYDTRLEDRLQGHEREHQLISIALEKAESQMHVRLEGMNEFRQQLDRQGATFATKDQIFTTREMADKQINALGITVAREMAALKTSHIDPLIAFQNKLLGAIAAVGILNAVLAFVLRFYGGQ